MTEILVLSRSDLRQLMTFSDYVDVVAEAFQLLAQGQCQSPVPTEIREERGTFHIKPGSLPRGAGYVAVKINGNFPSNRASCGLPTIQGAVYLADSSNGRPLALLDSMEITVQRTGRIGPCKIAGCDCRRGAPPSPIGHRGWAHVGQK